MKEFFLQKIVPLRAAPFAANTVILIVLLIFCNPGVSEGSFNESQGDNQE